MLTVSERSKPDLVELYASTPARRVTPNGVDPAFIRVTPGARLRSRGRRDPAAEEPARGARRRRARLVSARRGRADARRRTRRRAARAAALGSRATSDRATRRAVPRRRVPDPGLALRGVRTAGAGGDGVRTPVGPSRMRRWSRWSVTPRSSSMADGSSRASAPHSKIATASPGPGSSGPAPSPGVRRREATVRCTARRLR